MACNLLKPLTGIMRTLVTSLFLLGGPGCVIPPPISLDETDAAAPAHHVQLRLADITPSLATPWVIHQTKPGGTPKPQEFVVLFDGSGGATIPARLFLDGVYTAFIAEKTGVDIVRFTLPGFCDDLTLGTHFLEVYISDSGFEDKDASNLRITNTGGNRDNATWAIDCEPPT
jgi:hypothetical protein